MREDDRDEDGRLGGGRTGRRAGPRFGSIITIALALLMLFGAVSRMGKLSETAALFGIDLKARENISLSDMRSRTVIALGPRPAESGQVSIDPDAPPPPRPDAEQYYAIRENDRRGQLSVTADESPVNYAPWDTGAPEEAADTSEPEPAAAASYTVRDGDTWVKIAARTLGDAKRWKEIQGINPGSSNGLKVGMLLKLPR